MMTSLRGLRILVWVQLGLGLVFSALTVVFYDLYRGASFAAGSALMAGNVAVLGWTWWRILEKKPIAWTVTIIVIKYAVLLSTIVYLTRQSWFEATAAGLGVFSFVLAAVLAAALSVRKVG